MIDISSIDMIFSIGIFKDGISKLVSKYKFQLVSIKTLLKEFCLVKGKTFETGGEISKLGNASCNLIHIPLTICKSL
jgi:hypothetical protein